MTTEQLRDKYEQENGIRCVTPKGDGDIRYVEWLENEVESKDEQIEHHAGIALKNLKAVREHQQRIKELEDKIEDMNDYAQR